MFKEGDFLIELNNNFFALFESECPENLATIEFKLHSKYFNINNALKIDFKNDYEYSLKCIKKLLKLEKSNTQFLSVYNNLNIKYVVTNYTDEILDALKAICITDIKERYTFIYRSVYNSLSKIWIKNNPCNFCNNKCIATRTNKFINQDDGCCYSFEYTKTLFSTSLIKNKKKCKYLNQDKSCATRNISCKLFVCNYLKKSRKFNINIHNILLIMAFFSPKQILILKYNFFHSEEEIIDKLLEKNSNFYLFYLLYSQYRISTKL